MEAPGPVCYLTGYCTRLRRLVVVLFRVGRNGRLRLFHKLGQVLFSLFSIMNSMRFYS
jgi:hypothetical protein